MTSDVDIVIVDPSTTVRRVMRGLLASAGLTLLEADVLDTLPAQRDPQRRVLLFLDASREPASVAHLDARLPPWLTRVGYDLVVSSARPQAVERALTGGARPYAYLLERPFTPAQIIELCREHCARVRSGDVVLELTPRMLSASREESGDWATVTALLRGASDEVLSAARPRKPARPPAPPPGAARKPPPLPAAPRQPPPPPDQRPDPPPSADLAALRSFDISVEDLSEPFDPDMSSSGALQTLDTGSDNDLIVLDDDDLEPLPIREPGTDRTMISADLGVLDAAPLAPEPSLDTGARPRPDAPPPPATDALHELASDPDALRTDDEAALVDVDLPGTSPAGAREPAPQAAPPRPDGGEASDAPARAARDPGRAVADDHERQAARPLDLTDPHEAHPINAQDQQAARSTALDARGSERAADGANQPVIEQTPAPPTSPPPSAMDTPDRAEAHHHDHLRAPRVEGDLWLWSLPEVLRHVQRRRLNALIEVRDPEPCFRLHVCAGRLDWIEPLADHLHRPLGQLLIGAGVLDAAGLEQALRSPEARTCSLGEVLVGQGRATHEQLIDALVWQTTTHLWDALHLQQGRFTLEMIDGAAAHELPRLQLDPSSLIYDFYRRFPHHLPSWRPPAGYWLYVNEGPLQRLSALRWTPLEQWTLATLRARPHTFDGLREHLFEAGTPDAALKQIVTRLYELDVLSLVVPEPERGA